MDAIEQIAKDAYEPPVDKEGMDNMLAKRKLASLPYLVGLMLLLSSISWAQCDPDQDRPEITLNGEVHVIVECGTSYIDAGATAWDDCDGDITSNIEVGVNAWDCGTSVPPDIEVGDDTIDLGTVGCYLISYTVSDAAGNAAVPVLRLVQVVDTNHPRITLIDDAIFDVELGATAFDLCDGDITDRIERVGTVDTMTPGEYRLVYTVADTWGNTATITLYIYVIDTRPVDDLDSCLAECLETGYTGDTDGDGLTTCQEYCYGTSDHKLDTDEDGMPDGWEVRYGLNPLRDDAYHDLDDDNLTNIEEYLAGSDPTDPNSPRRTYFVALDGVDHPERGTPDRPFRTITYALAQAAPATKLDPAAVVVSQGYYTEDVLNLPRYVSLEGRRDQLVVIEAQINALGAVGASLSYFELRPPFEAEYMLFIEGLGVRVSGVTFRGMGLSITGVILVPSRGTRSSEEAVENNVIESCIFTWIDVGIEIYGELPTLRRNLFANILSCAIRIYDYRSTSTLKSMGDVDNPESGFNTFKMPGADDDLKDSSDSIAVINDRDETISMQNNDWDTDDPDAIAARIDGPVDYEPFLPKGAGMTAAALFCTVTKAQTQLPLDNATVTLGTLTVTRNQNGVYAFPAVAPGVYTLTITAPSYLAYTQNVVLNESAMVSITAPLRLIAPGEGEQGEGEGEQGEGEGEQGEGEGEQGEGEGEGEGEEPPPGRCCRRNDDSKSELPDAGNLLLSGLALLVLTAYSQLPKNRR